MISDRRISSSRENLARESQRTSSQIFFNQLGTREETEESIRISRSENNGEHLENITRWESSMSSYDRRPGGSQLGATGGNTPTVITTASVDTASSSNFDLMHPTLKGYLTKGEIGTCPRCLRTCSLIASTGTLHCCGSYFEYVLH